jgi:phage shock protein A
MVFENIFCQHLLTRKMETSISDLEAFAVDARDRLARIETRLDIFATKADLHRELHGMTWRLLGGASALVGIVYWIARTVQ